MFELDTPVARKVIEDLKKEHKTKIGFYPCDVTNTPKLEGSCFSLFHLFTTELKIKIHTNDAIYVEQNISTAYAKRMELWMSLSTMRELVVKTNQNL